MLLPNTAKHNEFQLTVPLVLKTLLAIVCFIPLAALVLMFCMNPFILAGIVLYAIGFLTWGGCKLLGCKHPWDE